MIIITTLYARILTCIIGARGADGCVIISDTRQMEDDEAMKVSKIYPVWGNMSRQACEELLQKAGLNNNTTLILYGDLF
jgi:3-mercaptopyruvate sulfurtransferase SseA